MRLSSPGTFLDMVAQLGLARCLSFPDSLESNTAAPVLACCVSYRLSILVTHNTLFHSNNKQIDDFVAM